MTFSTERLSSFVSWVSQQQAIGVSDGTPWVTTLTVGRATNNRAVSFKAELFRVEPTGWIGDELLKGGSLTLWENGCADADFWNGPSEESITSDHWDDVDADQFDILFSSFLARLKD